MARTLPWLASARSTTTPKSSPSTRAPKRQRLDDDGVASPSSARAPGGGRKLLSTLKRRDGEASPPPHRSSSSSSSSSSPPPPKSLPAGKPLPATAVSASTYQPPRTPSTSPPPPPPEIEYMRGGLDGDDIYVMVEDEFYAVAKTFTAHLHQAEYIRQRQLARERNAQGAAGIVRPVDGRTVLGAERMKEKERKKSDERTRSGVREVLGDSGSGAGDGEVEVVGARRRGAPATSLMGLMVSPSKMHRSLVGLQGPGLKSRAAAGFKQVQTTPSKNRILDAPALGQRLGAESGRGLGAGTATWADNDEDGTTASETDPDDLDATPTGREYSKPVLRVQDSASSRSHAAAAARSPSAAGTVRKTLFVGKVKSGEAGTEVDTKEEKGQIDRSGLRAATSMVTSASDLDGFLQPTPLPKPGARLRGRNRESRPT